MLARFESLLASGRDDPMLRLTLGQGYLAQGRPDDAAAQLRAALEAKPDYTAAWKFLGKALEAAGDLEGARSAWAEGLAVADRTGDRQIEREMQVFLRRLDKRTR
ncbi:MAG: tetratricopeptide repeat protein [Pseudomonadota bacterium]